MFPFMAILPIGVKYRGGYIIANDFGKISVFSLYFYSFSVFGLGLLLGHVYCTVALGVGHF